MVEGVNYDKWGFAKNESSKDKVYGYIRDLNKNQYNLLD
jgi:hypothetical protein